MKTNKEYEEKRKQFDDVCEDLFLTIEKQKKGGNILDKYRKKE